MNRITAAAATVAKPKQQHKKREKENRIASLYSNNSALGAELAIVASIENNNIDVNLYRVHVPYTLAILC